MFPPPWTAVRYAEHAHMNLLEPTRTLQDWEKKRHLLEAGPSRLLRPHSHHGCPQNRGRSAGKESDTHANISTWTIGECSASELPLVPSQTQLARDSCLSIPKHSPKLCVAIHGGCGLFGQDALLPLQSQARARARSQATTSARSAFRGTHRSFGQRTRLLQNDISSINQPGRWRRAVSNGGDCVRWTAWGNNEGGVSMPEHMRHVVNARCTQEDPERPPLRKPDSENDLSVERPVSDDSISTHGLLYGNECRGEAPFGGDGGCSIPRPSDGEERRRAFFNKFHEVADRKQTHPLANVTTVEKENARAMVWTSSSDYLVLSRLEEATATFLRQLSDNGRAPWPAILKWSEKTRAIEVGGMGLGDEIMTALATVLPILRNVERFVAFDNRTTDPGTHIIVKAVQGMPYLTYLDLSENEVGAQAAHELREYMRSNKCQLRSLAIRKADIDDDECREFMAALGSNTSLEDVDLAGNLIGKQETMKVTGAESVAAMLSTNRTLTNLNLGWNSLRMESAVTVAQSLRHNHTLQTLGLAYNSFSGYASQILAVSLFENDTLTSLDLSYNSVTPSAALVLAFALKVNTTVKFVELEGNRIGHNGGEALVTAMRVSQGNLIVSMNKCDTSHRDETLFNVTNATGEYDLDLQMPYNRVVASELLTLSNRKPTAQFRSLKHIVGKKIVNLKLHRENRAVAPLDPRVNITRRIEQCMAKNEVLELELITEYSKVLGMRPEASVADKMKQTWNEVLARDSGWIDRSNSEDTGGGDFATSSFFESLFILAEKDNKGELTVEDLETLFKALHLPYGEARMRHIMSKYDADRSGSVNLEEFTHYMSAAHLKQRFVQHGLLCTEDGKEWQVPHAGILRVHFIQEPSSNRTLGEMSTDCGVEGLITNIRRSPTDDTRKRLFELATSNSGTYYTSYQAQGLLEAISSNYHLVDAVSALMPQLASSQECAAFIDSNLDHRLKLMLRFKIGGAWGAMMGLPSGHYSLDMQNARDRLTASKMAAVANHERQHSKFNALTNTSQHGNWLNFRNAEYNRESVVLTTAWFINLPNSGILRFDYVSTSSPDYHQVPLPGRRFQRILDRLGMSTPITSSTPTDETVVTTQTLRDVCTSHWRKMASSSPVYKLDQRDYYRSGSSLDDVSLASWWSAVEVTSVNIERRDSFAHLAPSDTYIKAWYKLKELEVALCSTCLTSCQLAGILESFPREGQIRAEVVIAFYHKVTDIEHMCLLVDALRPDEEREVIARRGHLNVINPVFADRYYRLDLGVWDEREMAKILIRLAMMEPGENWLDETFQRNIQMNLIPGWELPLDWTTPDITTEKKDGGPPKVGILTLWYSSAPRRGCAPKLHVRQDLEARTLCTKTFSNVQDVQEIDILDYTLEWQQRFQSIMDKTRTGRPLLTDDIACRFTSEEKPYHDDDGTHNEELARTSGHTATSSITTLSNEGGPNVE
ncbi:unnamed protein product [Pylaiella littoralis]